MIISKPTRAIHALLYFICCSLVFHFKLEFWLIEGIVTTNAIIGAIYVLSGLVAITEVCLIALQFTLHFIFKTLKRLFNAQI